MLAFISDLTSAGSMAGTIFGSSLVVATVTHLLTGLRAEKELRNKKLEEVFVSAATFKKAMSQTLLLLTNIQMNILPVKQGHEQIHPLVFITIEEFDKAMILANIYFPILIPYLQTFLEQRMVIANALAKYIMPGRLLPENDFQALSDRCIRIDDQYATLLAVAYMIARDMNTPFYRRWMNRLNVYWSSLKS